jgi:transposase
MSNQRYSPEFKDEAVRQVLDRGYSVAEVSERPGVSAPLGAASRLQD